MPFVDVVENGLERKAKGAMVQKQKLFVKIEEVRFDPFCRVLDVVYMVGVRVEDDRQAGLLVDLVAQSD